mmetsp:Transcript_14840/g.31061  ORF Transcript_14840/g.31061 Transcript_14840/m.31061 type:complete len:106 (-) Transcript_14840:62-379(-)
MVAWNFLYSALLYQVAGVDSPSSSQRMDCTLHTPENRTCLSSFDAEDSSGEQLMPRGNLGKSTINSSSTDFARLMISFIGFVYDMAFYSSVYGERRIRMIAFYVV